jgi:hypothetical protein
MPHVLFFVAGILAGIHVFTYGRWLKREGNAAGAWLAYLLAAGAVATSVYQAVTR